MGRVAEVASFYKTKAWQHCREAYARSQGYLCEECLKRGVASYGDIVHHKRHVDINTVMDPTVTLAFDNLELLCRKCHATAHGEMYGKNEKRYKIVDGKVQYAEKNKYPPLLI